MAGILVLTAFALVLDGIVGRVERHLMKWQRVPAKPKSCSFSADCIDSDLSRPGSLRRLFVIGPRGDGIHLRIRRAAGGRAVLQRIQKFFLLRSIGRYCCASPSVRGAGGLPGPAGCSAPSAFSCFGRRGVRAAGGGRPLRLQDHRAFVRLSHSLRLSADRRGPGRPVLAYKYVAMNVVFALLAGLFLSLLAGTDPRHTYLGLLLRRPDAGRHHAAGHDAAWPRGSIRKSCQCDPAHRQAVRGAVRVRLLRRPVAHLGTGVSGQSGGVGAGGASGVGFPRSRCWCSCCRSASGTSAMSSAH